MTDDMFEGFEDLNEFSNEDRRLERDLLRRRVLTTHGLHTSTWRCLLTFSWKEKEQCWEACPHSPFKPEGLIIWGAPDGATFSAMIGNTQQVTCNYFQDAPCKFFSMGKNFHQIAALIDEGIDPPTWVKWTLVRVGNICRFTFRNHEGTILTPKDGIELVMWGESVL